jgi:uncharacterized protein YoxC
MTNLCEHNKEEFKVQTVPARPEEQSEAEKGNIEVVYVEIDVKSIFENIARTQGYPFEPKKRYLTSDPKKLVESFKSITDSYLKKIEQMDKTMKTQNKLTDISRIAADIHTMSRNEELPHKLMSLEENSRHRMAEKLFDSEVRDAGYKLVIEMYPSKPNLELAVKEERLFDQLKESITELEDSVKLESLQFVRDGKGIKEALQQVKKTFELLSSPQAKVVHQKIEKLVKQANELKYLSSDDKLNEEESKDEKKMSALWDFCKFALKFDGKVNNGLIFFYVLNNVQSQIQGFGSELTALDGTIKGLTEESRKIEQATLQARDSIKGTFEQSILQELNDLEKLLKN